MKGLDLVFCQHQINLHKGVEPVQQRRYRLNPNYAVKVKEEIDKLSYESVLSGQFKSQHGLVR